MRLVNYLFVSLIVAAVFSLTSCKEEPVTPDDANIVDLAKQTPELTSFAEALEYAELSYALEGVGAKTVFAPNNQAFQNLLDSNPDWNSLEDINKQVLANILLFHVIEGSVMSTDLTSTYVNTLGEGPEKEALSLQIDLSDGVRFNGTAAPLTTDIEASNGVIHIINEVMMPLTVVNLALNNDNFSILVSALTRDDLSTDFVETLSGPGPFTIFAPTNQAFLDLLESSEDWNSLDDIPAETLEAVLKYHVVSGANVQSDELSNDQQVTSLGGSFTVMIDEEVMLKTSSDQTVNVILTDVQGNNGVIHVVNEVLLP